MMRWLLKCCARRRCITIAPLIFVSSCTTDFDFAFEALFAVENATALTLFHEQGDVELPSLLTGLLWVSLALSCLSYYLQTFENFGLRTCLERCGAKTGYVRAFCIIIEDIPNIGLSLAVSMWSADGDLNYNGNFGATAMANLITAGFSIMVKLAEAMEERSIDVISYSGLDLQLSRRHLDDGQLRAVCRNMSDNRSVRYLHLSENNFRSTVAVGQMLAQNTCLEILNLAWNRLELKDLEPIRDGLAANHDSKLRHIYLAGNPCCDRRNEAIQMLREGKPDLVVQAHII